MLMCVCVCVSSSVCAHVTMLMWVCAHVEERASSNHFLEVSELFVQKRDRRGVHLALYLDHAPQPPDLDL